VKFVLVCAALVLLLPPRAAGAEEDSSSLIDNLYRQIRDGDIEIMDLTHPLREGMPVFPGGPPFDHVPTKTYELNGYASNRISMGEHTGTHMDAPYHFHREGRKIHEISLKEALAPLCVIDIRRQTESDANYKLTPEDLLGWEAVYGVIPPKAVVILWTGQDRFWDNPDQYVNMGADRLPHFSGFSDEAARFLIEERDIGGAGTDALSVDPGRSKKLTVHRIFHGAQKFHLENLTHLDRVPPRGALLLAFPIPIENGSGAPVRAVALVSRKRPA
jgi:kynurenine formamidase